MAIQEQAHPSPFVQCLGYSEQPLGTDPSLQHTVELLSAMVDIPVAFISIFSQEEQIQVAQVGIDIDRIPLHESICQFAICQENELFIIEDSLQNPDTRELAVVQGAQGIRFYAGIILRSRSGEVLGSMGVIDYTPRLLTEATQRHIKLIGRQVASYFQQRMQTTQQNKLLREALESKLSLSEAIKRNQERSNQQLFESITSSHLTTTYSVFGKTIQVNGHFSTFLGYPTSALLDRPFLEFIPSTEIPIWEKFWPKLLAGMTHHSKVKYIHSSGKEIWLYSSFCPAFNEIGQVDRVMQIGQDITRQVRIEGDLRKAKQKADDLNKQKDIFIANVSHEIRTPINAILGYTDILLGSEEDPVKSQQLRSIQYAGDSLLHLVNDILDYSKIESGLFQFQTQAFDLPELLHHVQSLLVVKAAKKGIQLTFHHDPKIPPILIGDAMRLSQILINLIGNGLKFTSVGGVHTETKLVKDDPLTIQFAIQDTGIGIPADRTEAVFERYHQATSGTSKLYGGTGLGLSICRHLVEKQGGTIWLASEEGKGTTLFFQLSFSPGEEVTTLSEVPLEGVQTSVARILMCEDNEINTHLATTLFAKTRYQLDTAPNGKKGIEKILQESYDLILMDIQMPEMDGLEATLKLRNEYHLTIPIIGLSAHALPHERDNCLQFGMNDYIAKPYKKEELFSRIEFWIAKENLALQNNLPLLNLEELQTFTGGDEIFQRELLSLLIAQLTPMIEEMKNSLKKNDFQHMGIALHSIKGSLGVMAVDISLIAKLEIHIRENNPETLPLAKRVLRFLEEIKHESEIALSRSIQTV